MVIPRYTSLTSTKPLPSKSIAGLAPACFFSSSSFVYSTRKGGISVRFFLINVASTSSYSVPTPNTQRIFRIAPKLTTACPWLVCYILGIYLLNLFLAFLQPKFDPSLTQDESLEDGGTGSEPTLPIKQDEEFRPFIRRLPEFKFWHSATRAIAIAFMCSWSEIFNVPVFWPVLGMATPSLPTWLSIGDEKGFC